MASRITMKHKENNLEKKAYIGFSWTSLLFGFFPAMFRGDWKGVAIYLAICIFAGAATVGVASTALWIIWPFIYNKWYARRLIENGYIVVAAAGMTVESVRAYLEK